MFFKHLFNQIKVSLGIALQSEDQEEKRIMLLRMGQGLLVALALVITFLAYSMNPAGVQLYYGIGISLLLIWGASLLHRRIKLYQAQRELRCNWGKEIKKTRDFTFISDFYEIRKEQEDAFFVDDRTWLDLDMDHIYTKLDRTQTNPGEQYLYYLLRKPEMDGDELKRRNEVIETLQTNKEMRESLQMILNRMGNEGGAGLVSFLWGDNLSLTRPIWIYRFMHFLALGAILFTVLRPQYWIVTIVPAFLLNMIIHYREKKKIYDHLGSLFYLGRFLAGARRLIRAKAVHPEIVKFQQQLEESLRPVQKLAKKTSLFVAKNDPIVEYFFIIFLTEVRTFYSVIDSIQRHRSELQQIYLTIGQLDSYLSIASYRSGLPYYSEPRLDHRHVGAEVVDLYHPLLEHPVSNSFHLTKRGALITGSNMSGKSTLLRAVGINALLAQTIYTSLSKMYRGNFYKLLTSIGRSDNVISGDSYYLVEAKALKRILETLSEERPILCIVDEIFRGTNSLERIAASAEVLRYLSRANCLLFAATHDLELTEMLDDELHNYHFKEMVDEKGLNFDYQLRVGPSTTRNAINLLDYLGYPEEILEGARQAIANMESATVPVMEKKNRT